MGVESDDEFRDFMRSRWSAMVRLAYTLTGDQGHAEDIAQAAFSSAYSAWGRVRRNAAPVLTTAWPTGRHCATR